jgi:hypothetical protein
MIPYAPRGSTPGGASPAAQLQVLVALLQVSDSGQSLVVPHGWPTQLAA